MTTERNRPYPSAGASAAARWPALRRFIAAEQRFARRCSRHPAGQVAYEFVRFGVKQAWACLFGAFLLALLLATHLWYPRDALLPRYDAILIGAVAIQVAMLVFGLETREEAKVILVFHVVGTIMEIFKTAAGSWAYPEPSFARIGGVPLFSGFMYAAVGSYIARVWRLFDFQFTRHPPLWALAVLSTAIYVNFFAHHFVTDIRLVLFVGAALAFGPAVIHFRIWRVHRSMPLLLGLCLVALFIWFAENLATFARAWSYPHQAAAWQPVPLTKFGAWFLLMIISYTLVAAVHGITSRVARRSTSATRAITPSARASASGG
jgi:uncharacterized membrane protein YoaT (DUF817 family)